ncbi:MAG TPA: hypothetical protein VEA61_05740 [Allosphingosinicella sp.]|nr:hypothetical protein [Allosphingosinicella sp.]
MLALAVAGFASASAAAAAPDPSAHFAAEALRICVDTGAAAAPVRQLAAAERWTKVDAKALPYPSSLTMGDRKLGRNVTYHPSDIWTIAKDGLTLIVAVYDIPERPKARNCEVMAWDLDSTAVDRALKSDRRVKGGFPEPGIPSRRYWVKGTYFRYGAGEIGGRTLHHLAAM